MCDKYLYNRRDIKKMGRFMTKLEKVGFIIAILSGIVTILEYLEKNNIISYFEWVPLIVKNIFSWIYENVILFEINIWVLLILIYLSFKAYKTYHNRHTNKDKNPIDYYKKMSVNHKLIFNVVAKYHDNNHDCMMNNLQRDLREYQISNLEIEQIIEELENTFIIESHPNFMAPPTYNLTEFGRNIAVELIKQSGQTK